MVDMDLDDLFDGPAKAPSRPSRFAPKGAKLKPRPKTEPSSGSDSISLPGKEKLETSTESSITKTESSNGTVKMDTDFKMDTDVQNGVKKEEIHDFMEMEEKEPVAELEDEVVREIDVYFNPSVDSNTRLYVLQYPLRPLWRPYELDDRCDVVRVKPESAELEFDLAIDVDSKNYNSDSKLQMEKQTLTSIWKPPHTSGYAVGVLAENKLHLNPVHAVVQLRPSMRHLDSGESKRKIIASNDVKKTVKAEEPPEGSSSGPSRKMIKPLVQNQDSEEDWVPLRYLGMRSDLASRYMHRMAAAGGSSIHFSMSSYDYLDSLCPGTSNDSFRSKGPPRRELLSLPLEERLKTWLREGPPVQRFDALKYLAKEEPDEQILGILRQHALLVQGLWVPKSSLVYETDQGIEVLARDYVLVLFSKNVLINNSQIPHRPQFAKAMRQVLSVLAVERPAFNDWKLKELPDLSFLKRYPSLVKKQEEEWQNLEKKLNEIIGVRRGGPGTKASSSSHSSTVIDPSTSKASGKFGIKAPKVETSRTAMTEETREAITKAVQKLFQKVKVCSFQQISQRIRDMAVAESSRSTAFAKEAVVAANSIDAFPNELQAIIAHVAVNIHGVFVPKSSPDHPQYDPFRGVVIDLFLAEGPSAKLKRATIIEAAKMKLQREIPQAEFQKVVQELCLSVGSAWVLRSGDGNPKH